MAYLGLRSLKLLGVPVLLSVPIQARVIDAQAAEIVVSWTQVEHQVRPQQGTWRVSRSVRLTLRGGNAVSESVSATNARGQSWTGSAEGRLRDSMQVSGTPRSTTWKVQDSRTLIRTFSGSQHLEVIRVTMDASGACRAQVSYQLKPGFAEYRMLSISRRTPLYFSSLQAEQIRCTATT